jgi:hypothetical protein
VFAFMSYQTADRYVAALVRDVLSGIGVDRKAQAKELRRARGLYDEYMKQAAQVRGEAHEKYRAADRLECNAWNAIMFCGGPAEPSPTIGTALNAGYDFLEVRCNRCGRLSKADLKKVRRAPDTPLHVLEPKLFCEQAASRKNGNSARTSSALPVKSRPMSNRRSVTRAGSYRIRICGPLIALLPGYFSRCSPTRRSRFAHKLSTVACILASNASAGSVLMPARCSD